MQDFEFLFRYCKKRNLFSVQNFKLIISNKCNGATTNGSNIEFFIY